jgi:hypothetical protein
MVGRNRYKRLLKAGLGENPVKPMLDHPGRTLAGVAAVMAVIGTGIWIGLLLRRKRIGTYRSPYESRRFLRGSYDDFGEYGAVGI